MRRALARARSAPWRTPPTAFRCAHTPATGGEAWNRVVFGTSEPPAVLRRYDVDGLRVELVEQSGALGRVSIDGEVAFEGISFVLRDEAWGTTPLVLSGAPEVRALAAAADSAAGLRIQCTAWANALRVDTTIDLRGGAAPSVDVRARATHEAAAPLLTARAGFVLLHSLRSSAGRPVQLGTTAAAGGGGAPEERRFPALDGIDGQQPLQDISWLRYGIGPPLLPPAAPAAAAAAATAAPAEEQRFAHSVLCELDGGVWDGARQGFEMEDQRLWTDASFKTYVRPLAWRWPYSIEAGEEVEQSVRLTFEPPAQQQGNTGGGGGVGDGGGVGGGGGGGTCATARVAGDNARRQPGCVSLTLAPWPTGVAATMPAIAMGLSAADTLALQRCAQATGGGRQAAAWPSMAANLAGVQALTCTVRMDDASEDCAATMRALQAVRSGPLCTFVGGGAADDAGMAAPRVHLEVVLPLCAAGGDSGGDGQLEWELCHVARCARNAGLLPRAAHPTRHHDAAAGAPPPIEAVTVVWEDELSTSAVDDIFLPELVDFAALRAERSARARRTLRAARRAFGESVQLGAGALLGFTELRRWGLCDAADTPAATGGGSPPPYDFVTHTTTAIVHDADDRAVMLTTSALPHVGASVAAMCGSTAGRAGLPLPYRVGPSAIGMRFNPWGVQDTAPLRLRGDGLAGADDGALPCGSDDDVRRTAMVHGDPRQSGLFGAAFTVAYVARLAGSRHGGGGAPHPALRSIALGDVLGPRGAFDLGAAAAEGGGASSPVPRPVAHVIGAAAAVAGQPLLDVRCSDAEAAQAFATCAADGSVSQVVVANTTNDALRVDLGFADGVFAEQLNAVATLDVEGWLKGSGLSLGEPLARDSEGRLALKLGPYAVARIFRSS